MLRFLSILILGLSLSHPLAAQTGGAGATGGDTPHTQTCAQGDHACLARLDRLCRAEGDHVTGQPRARGALALSCAPGRGQATDFSPETDASAPCSTATPICSCSGSHGSGGGVYYCLIEMQTMCLASGGQFQLDGILAEGPDSATAYGTCLPRR